MFLEKGNIIVFLCDCGTHDHQFSIEFDEEDRMYYLLARLRPWEGFFRRLWSATRYVFGQYSRFGDFDCVSITEHDTAALRRFLYKIMPDRISAYEQDAIDEIDMIEEKYDIELISSDMYEDRLDEIREAKLENEKLLARIEELEGLV